MKIVVTGGEGFLGWHLRCALRARNQDKVLSVGRGKSSPSALDAALRGVDVVFHCAGINRDDDDQLRLGNLTLAQELTLSLDRVGAIPAIVYANSIHSGNGTAFGDGKAAAADHLRTWAAGSQSTMSDVFLPNLFGEHGRPQYNSFIATFCNDVAAGRDPTVTEDREVPLLHVQRAVEQLLDLGDSRANGRAQPEGRLTLVSGVRDTLESFRDLYATGQIPDISDPFDLDLFNTYRSYCFPALYPIRPTKHSDERGDLFECLRAHGGEAQVFCSSTRPGFTRGEHFHLRKVERFLVVSGKAQIALRKLFSNDILRFDVSGDEPSIIDMPTMWAHNITNTGQDELMTLFWAHELLDPAHTDTYPERVQPSEVDA